MKSYLLTILILFYICGVSFAQDDFPLTEIGEVSESIIKEIRYAGPDNFTGERVNGYEAEKCYLTQTAARALSRVQKELKKDSMSLKVFDCYRPQQAVDRFVRWASLEGNKGTKKIYFPNVPADELFSRGYIAEKSGHSRGSTVDLTIVRLPYKPPESFNYNCTDTEGYIYRGSELNMGTSYDCFDILSHTYSEAVSEKASENRKILLRLMEKEGFSNYSKEWWHFTHKPELYPETYFNHPVE